MANREQFRGRAADSSPGDGFHVCLDQRALLYLSPIAEADQAASYLKRYLLEESNAVD